MVLNTCPSASRTTFSIMSRCHPLPIKPLFQIIYDSVCLVPEASPVAVISTVKTDTHMSYWNLFFRIFSGNGKISDWHEACHFPVSVFRTMLSCVLHVAVRCADIPSLGSSKEWQPLNHLGCYLLLGTEWRPQLGVLLESLPNEVSYRSVTFAWSWQLAFICLSHSGFNH